jgi:hypothetical protein
MNEQRFQELVAKFEKEILWLLEKSLGFSEMDAHEIHIRAVIPYMLDGKPAWKAFKSDYYKRLSHQLRKKAGLSNEVVDRLIGKLDNVR